MDKAERECQTLNELFESEPTIHWIPVAEYDNNDEKIRDFTRQEQIEWIKIKKVRGINDIQRYSSQIWRRFLL